jgi:hypothetical protein
MSQENVELVRRWAECLAGGELPLKLSDPELRLDNIVQFPITGPYHGHEGLRRWWQHVAEAFEEIRFDAPWASLFWVRDGKIARAVGYASQYQALKAAGLRE